MAPIPSPPAQKQNEFTISSSLLADEAPPMTQLAQVSVMNPTNYGYEFCCPFEFVGCELSFHPTQIDAYIHHTIDHFFGHRPPPKAICIFCPQIFENPNERVTNWRERMRHIADHYRRLDRFEASGPDFYVIEYMRKKGIISSEDYKWATKHTERPACDGLVDFGHKTAEMKRKEEKAVEERYRERRRYKRKVKSKPKSSHSRSTLNSMTAMGQSVADGISTVPIEESYISETGSLYFPGVRQSSQLDSSINFSLEGASSSKVTSTKEDIDAVAENPISSTMLTTKIFVADLAERTQMGKERSENRVGKKDEGTTVPSSGAGTHESSGASTQSDRELSPDKCLKCLQRGSSSNPMWPLREDGSCATCTETRGPRIPKLLEKHTSDQKSLTKLTHTLDLSSVSVGRQRNDDLSGFIPTENRRKVLRVLIKKQECIACPDSGSEKNIISESLAIDRELTVLHRSKDIQPFELGNGEFVWSIGRVRVKVQVPGLPFRKNLNFYVFTKCPWPLVLGISFLAKTKILTRNRHLLEDCPRDMDKISSLLWIGSPRNKTSFMLKPPNRLRCCLDGRCLVATADSGSDLNMMSPKCARKEGFQIDGRPEARKYVEFGDGSQGETIGQVYVYRLTLDWRKPETKITTVKAPPALRTEAGNVEKEFGSEPKRTDETSANGITLGVVFHVLPGLPCDVVLGRDLLDKTDAFNLFPDLLSSKSRGMATAFEFKVYISLGRWSKKLPGFRDQKQDNTPAPNGKAAHDNQRHAEMYRRSEKEAELATLPSTQRALEDAKEKRKIRDWNAAHVNCVHCNPV